MPSTQPTTDDIDAALATVSDPEIRQPITDLDMVKSVTVQPDGSVDIGVYLTVSGCPHRDTISEQVAGAVTQVAGVTAVRVELDVMSDAQRKALQDKVRGDRGEKSVPFAESDSRTRVYAVASGKGGVGKSSVTVNLATALAAKGLSVGLVDADIYGFSIPRMLGVSARPTQVADMIMPPQAHGVRVISIGMFVGGNNPVVWRGPMLHRALQQFLSDVFWGDLDILLIDLPPGTGDIAISVAQLIPSAEILLVTTPQLAAREVAERAGAVALQTKQQVAGVIENMAGLPCPHCGETIDVFGAGGGEAVAQSLSTLTGAAVPLLGSVPIDVRLREGGDRGVPLVLSDPNSAAAQTLTQVAERLATRSRSLLGASLGISPMRRSKD